MHESLAFGLNFVHPLAMWVLLGLSAYALVLGLKVKKIRTTSADERKELIKERFPQRYFLNR